MRKVFIIMKIFFSLNKICILQPSNNYKPKSSIMSKTKQLFISMMQGLIDGVNIEKQLQRKFRDDENRFTIYKSKPKKKRS